MSRTLPPRHCSTVALARADTGSEVGCLCCAWTQQRGAGGMWVSNMIYYYPEKHPTSLRALNNDQGSLLVYTRWQEIDLTFFSLWASAENIDFTFWKYNANASTSSCFQISTDHIACTFFYLFSFFKVYTCDTAPPSARTRYCTLTLQVLHQSKLSSWEGGEIPHILDHSC